MTYPMTRILCALAMIVPLGTTAALAQDKPQAVDKYLELGTKKGQLGGTEQKAFELRQIKAQIKTFIPPLLRPAITQHAYVLPPNAFQVAVTHRFTTIKGDDFFMNGKSNLAVFRDAKVERSLTDIDLFYGFDLNRQYMHGFTVRVNIPYLDSSTDGSITPMDSNSSVWKMPAAPRKSAMSVCS